MIYLLDANVYIEAKNRYYRMTVCPGFWEWMDLQFTFGHLGSIRMVFDELSKSGDELSEWVKARQPHFIEVDDGATQEVFAKIAQFVVEYPDYTEPYTSSFLAVADPWLIAKAKILGATVVTHEVPVPPGSKKVKVPNICREFGVDFCNTFDLLESMTAQFVLRN
ncbi:DUF4411 family protein [Methylomicrobium lacus]|uniref:DUF4411 family protein n=1 Tax=Methylomicrobium lacus TaxID=136992 RepID=UPI00045E9A79|nr:DUF4411 family protein [Methylomicrobium lacus]